MSKIKLLFRHRSMELGGVEKVLLTIFKQLDPKEFEIYLLLNYAQGELLKQVPDHIHLYSIGKKARGFLPKVLRRLRFFLHEKFLNWSYRSLNIPTPDIEIASIHYNFKEVLNSPFKNSKKIAWLHGDMRNTAKSATYVQQMIRDLHRFHKSIWVSHFTLNIAQEAFKTKFKNAQVIYNPIEINEILDKSKQYEARWNDTKKLKFVFSGRIVPQKGIPELINASLRLANENKNFELVLLGDGELRKSLIEKVKKENKQDSIRFLGFQENPLPWVASADAYILPSHSEAYPLGVAEALVLGTPVLSTQVGGIPEMMSDGIEGEFFEKGESGIYTTLNRILEHPERLKIYKKNIQNTPLNFGVEEPINQILNLFR